MSALAENNVIHKQVKPKVTFELVQILRAFAALIVVGYHCHMASGSYFETFPFNKIFALGLFGVDFFFVLSGFIITYIHLSDLREQTSVGLFLRKRFFRIYPIYWVVALITFAYLLTVQSGKPEHLSHILQCNNPADLAYVIKSFLLLPQPEFGIVDVSWTLCFELIFYIVFALSIRLGWKFARSAFFIWITLILLQSFAVWKTENYYMNFFLNPLILEFLMGCLLGFVFREQKVKLTVAGFILFTALLAIVAFVYLSVFHHHFTRESWNYVLIIGIAVLAIWTCATLDKSRKFALKNKGVLLLLGNASYSIYLLHTLIIKILFSAAIAFFGKTVFLNSSLYTNLFCLAVGTIATIVGTVLHLRVEQPLLKFTNKKFVSERIKA